MADDEVGKWPILLQKSVEKGLEPCADANLGEVEP